MGAIVTVEKVTSGTEAERIVAKLEEALGRHAMREGNRAMFILQEQSGSWEELAGGVRRELDAISPTWSVHVRVVPAGWGRPSCVHGHRSKTSKGATSVHPSRHGYAGVSCASVTRGVRP